MGRGEEEHGAQALYAASCVLLGSAVALFCCLIFLILCAGGVSAGWLGEESMGQLTVCAVVLGSFIGGMMAVARFRSRTLIIGASVGAVLFLFLLTVGVLFYDGVTTTGSGLAMLCGCLCGGALAGLVGGRRKKRRK